MPESNSCYIFRARNAEQSTHQHHWCVEFRTHLEYLAEILGRILAAVATRMEDFRAVDLADDFRILFAQRCHCSVVEHGDIILRYSTRTEQTLFKLLT